MFNKLKKFLKSKRAVGSVATAIKVGTACVLGAAILVGGVALTNDIVLPNTSDKVQNVAEYEGDGAGGGSTGGVTPVSVPAAYNHDDPALNPTDGSWEGGTRTTPQNGDTYEIDDYTYTYKTSSSGWHVAVKYGKSYIVKSSYEPILESINGEPVTNMQGTFANCAFLTTAPVIPNSVTNMSYTFNGCASLTTAPAIPSSVTNMEGTFYNCTSLTGTITINANPTSYEACLKYTQITAVVGDTTLKDEILATKSANFSG